MTPFGWDQTSRYRQYLSSQLRDRRIAVRINPAIE